MFYQSKNFPDNELIRVENGVDFTFPAHLHGNFELITCTEGCIIVTVDKMQYSLQPGRAVLVFPNQIHSLHTPEHSVHLLCIFSPQLIRAYSNVFLSRLPRDHEFPLAPFYLESLCKLQNGGNELQVKGFLYSICGVFDENAQYYDRGDHKEDLLRRIFWFVEEHYSEDCSLFALAEHTSYHAVYLSRYFKQCTGISFTDHVNRYRVNEAAYALRNSRKKILEIALESGFESLRSFNRNFKNIMNMTPNEYRMK